MKIRYFLGILVIIVVIFILVFNVQQSKTDKNVSNHQYDTKRVKLTRDVLKFQPDFFEVSESKGIFSLTPIKAAHKKESEVYYKKQSYKLKQIQLFFPSKELVKGKKYPGEIRLQHETKSGNELTIVSHLEIGKENFALSETSEIAKKMKKNDEVKVQEPISTLALINQDYQAVQYKQSNKHLYIIFDKPITLSKKEFDNFKSYK
ncbi:hypothetical protein ACSMFR_01085 [Listeria aquatica]|uniref:hypothetical protein n=1 Tax=Listeria aquatica TaxID=1494960 RepID=UPI003F7216EA